MQSLDSNGDRTSQLIDPAAPLTVDQALENLRQRQDLGLRYYAAWWLGKFRVRDPEAIEALLEALSDERDRAPDGGYPLRRNAARALGKLGDRQVVPALLECLVCEDFYVRETAAEALGALADPIAIASLVQLLAGGVEAAKQAPGKPHLVQPYEAILEALGSLQATETIPLVRPFLEHPVPRVQYAAARAMYQLTGETTYGEKLVRALQVDELQLRRSALMDLAATDYLAAAEPISETLAENSLKLISMKGILENHIQRGQPAEAVILLSEDTIRVMELMDTLL